MQEIDNQKAWYSQDSVYPVGLSGNNNCYLIAVEFGKEAPVSFECLRNIYGQLIRNISFDFYHNITVVIPKIKSLDPVKVMQAVTEGIQLGSYSFDRYKTKAHPEKSRPCNVSLFLDEFSIDPAYTDGLRRITVMTEGIKRARDLINEPGNKLSPAIFADRILAAASHFGFSVEISDVAEMEKKNLVGILSVGKGSQRPPRLCVLKYMPDNKASTGTGSSFPTIAIVGKGVTTDLGGINLKIGNDLSLARTDMGGAAVVLSVLEIVAALKVQANVYGIIPLVENICDGGALKPGEILEYNNGTSVEIKNTDAEGRLILADGLLIAQDLHPDFIVDIATLTGSCALALGSRIAGILGQDELVDQIIGAGRCCDENLWKLPLFEDYSKEIKSDIADISNLSTDEPGVITAALFLKEFTGDIPWAHIDIAGTRNAKSTSGYIIKGGTGFGVKTLVGFIESISSTTI